MNGDIKDYIKISGLGAAFGITTSVLSCISHEVLSVPLGFSPLTPKNVVKVGVVSGGTTAALFALEENWRIISKLLSKINAI